ncbi:MAG TPA: hypothetical protein VKZ48_01260 [Burkholderiales bacterium]|nr:hypothetical protein [Burkholderiales bacterium]
MVVSKRNLIAEVSMSFTTLIAVLVLLQPASAFGQGPALPSPSSELLKKLETV